MRIVVAGWVAGFPNAGFFWHHASFALGFRDLGHEVWFLEDSGDYPYCWDYAAGAEDPSGRAGSAFLRREFADVGMEDRWVYRHMPTGRHDGMTAEQTQDVLAEADVFVNLSLTTPRRPEYAQVEHRIGVDTDPVFTQIRLRDDASAVEWLSRLYTFGRPPLTAQLPEHEWVPTRQPVATSLWTPEPPAPADAPFTTITTWKAYAAARWAGEEYGAKDASFRTLMTLPAETGARLQVALGGGLGNATGAAELAANGWDVVDASSHSTTTDEYRAYIRGSAGELAVAKHGYVAGRSGWFSERSCLYLASGRPVIAQDTGWSDWLPTGDGLFSYNTARQAADALEAARSRPLHHATAARALVEEHFDAATVCEQILAAL